MRSRITFGFLLAILSTILVGCAYSIADIDISKKEPTCARECTTSYMSCVSYENQVRYKTETLRACGEGYSACVSTCPAKVPFQLLSPPR
jgi:hypothetical protein